MEAWGVPQGEGHGLFDDEHGGDSPGESWVLPLRAPKPAPRPEPVIQTETMTQPEALTRPETAIEAVQPQAAETQPEVHLEPNGQPPAVPPPGPALPDPFTPVDLPAGESTATLRALSLVGAPNTDEVLDPTEAGDPSSSAAGRAWAFAGGSARHALRFPTHLAKAMAAVAVVLALLVAGLAYLSPKPGPVRHVLALSLAKGTEDRYMLTGVFNGTETLDKSTESITENLTGVLSLRVLSVGKKGNATMKVSVVPTSDRINGTSMRPATFEELIKVAPDGRILSTSGWGMRGNGSAGTVLLGLQQLTPLLPSGPVDHGARWSSSFDQKVRSANGPVRVTSDNHLVSYLRVDRATTAAVTSEVRRPMDYSVAAEEILGASQPALGGSGGVTFAVTGASSTFQTTWMEPVRGAITEASILGRVDLSLAIQGLPSDDPLSSLTGRIKGTLTVHLTRLEGQGAAGSNGNAPGADARDALRQALAAADLYFTAGETYSGFSPSKGSSLLPSTRWVRRGGARHGTVTIRQAKGTSLLLVTRDAGGAPFCIARTGARTRYGRATPSSPRGCHGGW
jgi:hypothetical protein